MVCMSDGPTQGVESLPATWRNWTFEVCLRVLPAGTPVPGAAALKETELGHSMQGKTPMRHLVCIMGTLVAFPDAFIS